MPIDNTNLVIADSEIRYLRSAHVGDEFKLFIAHPLFPLEPDQRVPVVYALDGNFSFGTVAETARQLMMSRDMGQCYVVGIGYRKNSAPEAAAIRCRDLTPARSPKFEEAFPKVMAMFGGQAPVTTGGGPQFLRFLVEELKLYIEAHFPVDPHDSTLAGLSFGGLFATYTLLNEPSAFQRYIICSPSLLYENEHIFAHEAAYAAQHRDLDARVFLTCGALESESESLAAIEKMPPAVKASLIQLWRPRMVELLEPFAERLRQRAYPSLKLTSHVFPGEHHNSVYPSAISRGLRVVFAK